jgi:uncharacterized repeat protein (TIGR01451 family)
MNRLFRAAGNSVSRSQLLSPQSVPVRLSYPIVQFTLGLLSTSCLLSAIGQPAIANQIPTSGTTWTGTSATGLGNAVPATKDTPSGLRMRISVGGTGTGILARNNTTLMTQGNTLIPALPTATNGLQLLTDMSNCPNGATVLTCSNLGTFSVEFLDATNTPIKVRNPIIHWSRLGGSKSLGITSGGVTTNYSYLASVILQLTTPNLKFGNPSGSSLAVSTGLNNNIRWGFPSTAPATAGVCSTTTSSAGCGSTPIEDGSGGNIFADRLDFSVTGIRSNASINWNELDTNTGLLTFTQDGYFLTASFEEDFGDAPASFDTGGAASHIISDLAIGNTIDVDNINTTNGGATGTPLVALSPNAVAAGASNNGSSGDGSEEDGVTTWNPLAVTATTYSTTVALSGVSRAARVCGWVDFNRNNAFDNPTERACADVVAGQTSAVLNWTGLAGLTVGNNYARLRLSYDLAGVQNPKGALNSGEVEDYQIAIAAGGRPTASTLPLSCPINTVSIANLDAGATNDATTIIYPNAGGGGRTMTVSKISGSNTISGPSPNIYKLGTGSPVGGIWLGSDDQVLRSWVGLDTETYEVLFDGDITALNMTFSAINGNTDGIEHIKILNVYNAAGTDITGTTNYGFVDGTPAGFGSLSFFTDTRTLEPTTYADLTAGGTYGNSNGTITLQNAAGMRRVVFQRLEPGNPNSSKTTARERSNGVGLGPIAYCDTPTIPAPITISGKIFNDANANVTIDGSDAGTNAGSSNLTVYAIDSTGDVVGKAIVAADGTYNIPGLAAGNYTLRLSNDASIAVGAPGPVASLPSSWVNTGENKNGVTETITPGEIAVTVASANVINQDFGIRIPIAPFVNGTCQPDGLVWVSGGDVASNKINQIGSYRISNGSFTNVVTTAKDWGDIAWATDNKLYGVEYTDISGSANPSSLYRIDPVTGQTTFITDLRMLGKVANSLSGLPNGGLIIGGDFYSKVYRYELSNATNPPVLWHDFGAGFPAGDFIPFNGKVYIAWNTGTSYQLYEVTVDANYDYISHQDLGALPDGSRGLALVMNKIYAVAGTNIHQINSIPTSPVTTIPTTIVPNMPAPYFLGGASGTEEPFGGCSQASDPNVLLVKRITQINGGTNTINGDSLAAYIDQLTNPYDDNTITIPTKVLPTDPPKDTDKWPDPATTIIGGINGGNIKPGDEMEYTIYFLSAGAGEAKNVLFCDRVPTNVSFIPAAFNSFGTKATGGLAGDRGILSLINGTTAAFTNIADGDAARYFPPGTNPTSIYPNLNCGGTNSNGAVVINLGNLPNATAPGTPAGAFGFVRFKGRVK